VRLFGPRTALLLNNRNVAEPAARQALLQSSDLALKLVDALALTRVGHRRFEIAVSADDPAVARRSRSRHVESKLQEAFTDESEVSQPRIAPEKGRGDNPRGRYVALACPFCLPVSHGKKKEEEER
jgi:hypothetical protein